MNNIFLHKPLIEERIKELLNVDFYRYNEHIKAMNYSVFNGGKRIRPCLLAEFSKICNGDMDIALDMATAIEFIQAYSLIHDDLPCMDDDDLRRGKPSCHIAYGESTALLAGDALLTYAFEVATRKNAPNSAKCVNILAKYAGMCGMIGGQMIDLATENQSADLDTVLTMYKLKTSRLLQASCVLGAIIAGADNEKIKSADSFAENLGIAFQITDDILDVTSTTEQLGKPVGSDVDNGKNNFVSILGIEKARQKACEYTDKAIESLRVFGSKADNLILFAQELLSRKA